MRVARNHVLSRLRKADVQNRANRNATREAPKKYNSTPEDAAMNAEQQRLLCRLLDTLSPQEQLMLNLHYTEGRKYSEIAEILNISINTVASRLHRCKANLRTKLKEHTR